MSDQRATTRRNSAPTGKGWLGLARAAIAGSGVPRPNARGLVAPRLARKAHFRRRFGQIVLTVLLVAVVCSCLPAEDALGRYFQALRERRLYSLAEGYALDQLQRPRTPLPARTAWTIELSKTFAEHAQQSLGDEQDQLWKRAEQVLVDLQRDDRDNPRRFELQAQSAWVRMTKARFLSSVAEFEPDDRTAGARAALALSDAIESLKEAERAAGVAAAAAKLKPAAVGFPVGEARAVQESLRLWLVETRVAQAQRLPRADPARASTLIDAEATARPLAGAVPADSVAMMARVLLAEIARLKGDAKQATSLIAALEKETTSPELQDRLIVIHVRLLLDSGRPDEAAALLLRYQKQRLPLPAELLFLKTTTLLALWEIADRKQSQELAGELWREADAQSAAAERDAPGWWTRRARLAFERARENKELGGELGQLVRQARASFAAGRTAEAIPQFQAAAALAEKEAHAAIAADLRFTLGSLLLQAGRFSEAVEPFRSVAESSPPHAKSADSSLLAAYALGRWYDAERTAERRQAYQKALETHRKSFSDSPTFGEATWRLATFQERRLQWTQALPLYSEIPAAHPRSREAHVAIARCWEAVLARVAEIGQPLEEWRSKADAQLTAIAETFPPAPQPLDRRSAEALVRFARILLQPPAQDFPRADRLLARAIESAAPSLKAVVSDEERAAANEAERSAWQALRRTAVALRIVSLAGSNQWSDAESLAAELADAAPADVLLTLDRLSAIAPSNDAAAHSNGNLRLKLIASLEGRKKELSDDEGRRRRRHHAEALRATRQPRAAILQFEAMLADAPGDLALRRTLAEVLMDCGDSGCLKKAREHWRTLEAQAKAGSLEFLSARYETARCFFLLGEIDECRKLLGVTKLLYPDRGSKELARQFDELERRAVDSAKPR